MDTKKFLMVIPILVAGIAMAACAPGASQPAPAEVGVGKSGEPQASSGPQPQRGGVWRFSQTDNPISLDPHKEISIRTQRITSPAYSGILQFDPIEQAKIIPDLAERWEVSQDGKTFTFYFRKGVKWHDGKDFTAKDAEFSLLRITDKSKGTLRPRSDWFPTVTKVEATDTLTLRITTSAPTASVLPNIASGWTLVLPQHIEAQKEGTVQNTVIGTGPFLWKEYKPSVGGTLERNPNYFVPDRPYLDKVEWSVIPDATTAFAAFRVGRLDTSGVDASQLEIVKNQMPGVVINDGVSVTVNSLRMNNARKPFDDVRVRKAISLAVNRQEIIQAIRKGLGIPAAPIMAGTPYALPQEELLKLPGYRQPKDQDIAEAKKLLADAGYSGGLKISCMAGQSTDTTKVGLVIIEQLKAIGIEMDQKVLEYGAVLDAYDKRDFNCGPYGGGRNSDEPDAQLVGYRCGGGWNYFSFCDDKTTQLLDQQSISIDESKRKAVLKELQLHLLDMVPEVFIYYTLSKTAIQPWVRNYKAGNVSYNYGKVQDVWMENQPK